MATTEEINAELEKLRSEARAVARRRMFPGGMVGDTSSVVNEARLVVIEDTLAAILAVIGGYEDGTLELKIGLMLIDHWQKVVAEVKGE